MGKGKSIFHTDPNRLLSLKEAATILNVSVSHLQHNIAEYPHFFKLGKKYVIKYIDLINFIDEKKNEFYAEIPQ